MKKKRNLFECFSWYLYLLSLSSSWGGLHSEVNFVCESWDLELWGLTSQSAQMLPWSHSDIVCDLNSWGWHWEWPAMGLKDNAVLHIALMTLKCSPITAARERPVMVSESTWYCRCYAEINHIRHGCFPFGELHHLYGQRYPV